jgi:hypothetical protein
MNFPTLVISFITAISAFCTGKNEISLRIASAYQAYRDYKELAGYCPRIFYKNNRYQPFDDLVL